MATLQIPQRFIPGFKILSKLSIKEVNNIATLLNSIQVGASADSFTQLLLSETNIKDAASLSETIFSLGTFVDSQEYPIEKVAKELSLSFCDETEDDKSVRNALQKKLIIIFSQPGSFRQTFKALSLISENEKSFRDARVISDIRLVFNEEINDKNRHAIIIHRLRIEYIQNEEMKEFYASLNSADLTQLKMQIDRAIEKEIQIKKSYRDLISFIEL